MRALCIYAGPCALRTLAQDGLQAAQIRTIPGAAGGPKGLIRGPLDRYLFGEWLPQSTQPLDLVGASIGAWRMATACFDDPVTALQRLERDYIGQHFAPPAGLTRPTAAAVSEVFGRNLRAFYGLWMQEVLHHPRYRLHVVTGGVRHRRRAARGLSGRRHHRLPPASRLRRQDARWPGAVPALPAGGGSRLA